jgi:hypothetical protein
LVAALVTERIGAAGDDVLAVEDPGNDDVVDV